MSKRRWQSGMIRVALVGGLLFAGPCGISTLQLQDFIRSTLIRTTVTTTAAVIESAVIAASQAPEAGTMP